MNDPTLSGPLADFFDFVRAVLHFTLNLPAQAADIAPHIDGLHYAEFSAFTAIGAVAASKSSLNCRPSANRSPATW